MQRKVPLRARNTLENRLWVRLKALEGFRFRRKSPFRTFTLDFAEHGGEGSRLLSNLIQREIPRLCRRIFRAYP